MIAGISHIPVSWDQRYFPDIILSGVNYSLTHFSKRVQWIGEIYLENVHCPDILWLVNQPRPNVPPSEIMVKKALLRKKTNG